LPKAARASVVVIARNGQQGHTQLANGTASRGDRGLAGCGGIEQVTRHEDKLNPVLTGNLAEAQNRVNALLLQERAFVDVLNSGEGFAELPVSRMQET